VSKLPRSAKWFAGAILSLLAVSWPAACQKIPVRSAPVPSTHLYRMTNDAGVVGWFLSDEVLAESILDRL
jgi:hypothetical protein